MVTATGVALLVGLVGLSAIATIQTQARNDFDRTNAELIATNKALDEQRRRAQAREAQAIDAVKKFRDAIVNEPELKNSPSLEAPAASVLEGTAGLLPRYARPSPG